MMGKLEGFAEGTIAFCVLDLTARFAFRTEASISFNLERYSQSLLPVRHMGWVDVHHPCTEGVDARIRVSLPAEYHAPDKLKVIIATILEAVAIPAKAQYEAEFFATSGVTEVAKRDDMLGTSGPTVG
jgi:hypothetical protein